MQRNTIVSPAKHPHPLRQERGSDATAHRSFRNGAGDLPCQFWFRCIVGLSGFPSGGNWDPGDRFQIAGGYDSVTGNGYFYVTPIDAGPVSSLIGSTFTFAPGAVQDSSPLSVGSPRSGADFVGQGAGFDLDDLQIYDGLLASDQLLFLANNPGTMIPEPTSLSLMAIGALLIFRKRFQKA